MTDNRRETFRAPMVEPVEGLLHVGRRDFAVQIIEQSAGGITVVSDEGLTLPIDAEAELQTETGLELLVRIKYREPRGNKYQIGLQRLETETTTPPDLRDTFHVSENGSFSLIGYALVVLVGFVVGYFAISGSDWRRLWSLISG